MIKKMALLMAATSLVLVFALPVLAPPPAYGTVTPQEHIGTA